MRITERRFGLEIRTAQASAGYQDSPGSLVGYASKFNSLSEDLGGFRERVAPTAFSNALRDPRLDVKALINHDPNLVIGRTTNGTCQLSCDDVGLQMRVILPNTSFARDLYTSVQRGDMSQMSFAFSAEDEDWNDELDPDDASQRIKVRTLRSVRLMDVSAVTYPAYDSTEIHAAVTSPALLNSLFPQGAPLEVRSRVGDVGLNLQRAQQRRKNLVDLMLSL